MSVQCLCIIIGIPSTKMRKKAKFTFNAEWTRNEFSVGWRSLVASKLSVRDTSRNFKWAVRFLGSDFTFCYVSILFSEWAKMFWLTGIGVRGLTISSFCHISIPFPIINRPFFLSSVSDTKGQIERESPSEMGKRNWHTGFGQNQIYGSKGFTVFRLLCALAHQPSNTLI